MDSDLVWVHTHCCERSARNRYAERVFGGKSSIEVLDEYGLLHRHTLLTHCIHCSDEDIDLIKQRKARVLTVPKFTDGRLAKIGAMLDKGIPVALCSDSYAIDPFSRMIHAYHLHRFFESHKYGSRMLSSLETVEMATIGAARAFGLDEELGSLEKDKRANVVLLDFSLKQFDPFWKPDFWLKNPKSQPNNWLYRIEKLIQCGAVSCRDVHTVIADGNVVKP